MMQFVSNIFGNVIIEAIGWFLIHSLWQGAIIALLLLISLLIFRHWFSQFRYYLSFAALILMVASSAITFSKTLKYANEKFEIQQSIVNNPDYLKEIVKDSRMSNTEVSLTFINESFSLKRAFRRAEIQKHFPWIVSIWFTGLLFYLLRIVFGLVYQYRLKNTKRDEIDKRWILKLSKFASQLKINKQVRIYISRVIKSPVTTGFLKPVILIPASMISGLSPEQIEAIVAHELAHIRRNDYIVNVIQTLVETLFFFHPAVWYISAQIRKERENACDDIAVELTGDKVNYAKTLAFTQNFIFSKGILSMTFSPFRQTLLKRIKRLNTKIHMKTNLSEKIIAGLIILTGFLFVSFIFDGNPGQFKNKTDSEARAVDSTNKSKIFVVHKTTIDSTGNKVVTKRSYRAKEAELDSLMAELEDQEKISREFEKVIELALAEDDEMLSDEIIHSIHIALEEMDIDMIVSEALEAAKTALVVAEKSLDEEEIRVKICKSMNENHSDSLDDQTFLIAKEAIEEACKVLDEMDIHLIVSSALEEAGEALKEIDMEVIVSEAMEEAHEELEAEHHYIIKHRKEFDEVQDLEEQRQILIEKEARLKQQLKELEEDMKEIKNKQKEEQKTKMENSK